MLAADLANARPLKTGVRLLGTQMNSQEFDECIEMLRSSDSLTYEDGYHWLQGYLDKYIDELVQLMFRETDPSMRSKFVELVGNSKNPKVIPFLEAELKSHHSEVSSLLYFENLEAMKIAECFRKENPNEDFL
jgi:hypothetical protein